MGGPSPSSIRAGCQVIATDQLPEAVACVKANALLNGVADRLDARLGDCYDPVRRLEFDLICTSPPQMPTPPERERDDPMAAADNGGADGGGGVRRGAQGGAGP